MSLASCEQKGLNASISLVESDTKPCEKDNKIVTTRLGASDCVAQLRTRKTVLESSKRQETATTSKTPAKLYAPLHIVVA